MSMNYLVTLRWNHKVIMHGAMSAVVASVVLEHLLVDNFAGKTLDRAQASCPSLGDLLDWPLNTPVTREVYDETGHARATIERVAL